MASVTVNCPCGKNFERQIGRGRPAIWCPECRTLPIAMRPPKPEQDTPNASAEASSPDTVEAAETVRTVSRYGKHDYFNYTEREAIEAGCKAVGEEYQRMYAVRGMVFPDSKDPARECSDWYADALREVYKKVAGKRSWWTSVG